MTATEPPAWTDYIVTVGPEYAKYLEESGVALGGLRIMDLGDGRAALDAGAARTLKNQPEDADGCVETGEEGYGHVMWLGGDPFPLETSWDTGFQAAHQQRQEEAIAWLEEGVTYGDGN